MYGIRGYFQYRSALDLRTPNLVLASEVRTSEQLAVADSVI